MDAAPLSLVCSMIISALGSSSVEGILMLIIKSSVHGHYMVEKGVGVVGWFGINANSFDDIYETSKDSSDVTLSCEESVR